MSRAKVLLADVGDPDTSVNSARRCWFAEISDHLVDADVAKVRSWLDGPATHRSVAGHITKHLRPVLTKVGRDKVSPDAVSSHRREQCNCG